VERRVKRLLGLGCTGLLLVTALLTFAFSQSEAGRWAGGLLFVYGGTMISGAAAFETVEGSVTGINRLDPPTSFSAGSFTFSYTDHEGRTQEARRRVMMSTPRFRSMEIGDSVSVWVCRSDPSIVRVVGYGTHEPDRCGTRTATEPG
jgi:hypothetical protein